MMRINNSENLGYRELNMVRNLLNAWLDDGLPNDFNDEFEDITVDFNFNKAYLANADGQVAMLNGDKIESYYTTPNQGVKGFLEDLVKSVESGEIDDYDDMKYVLELCDNAYNDNGIITCMKALIYNNVRTDVEGYSMTIEELDDELSVMDLEFTMTYSENDKVFRFYKHEEYDISFKLHLQSEGKITDDEVYEITSVEVA